MSPWGAVLPPKMAQTAATPLLCCGTELVFVLKYSKAPSLKSSGATIAPVVWSRAFDEVAPASLDCSGAFGETGRGNIDTYCRVSCARADARGEFTVHSFWVIVLMRVAVETGSVVRPRFLAACVTEDCEGGGDPGRLYFEDMAVLWPCEKSSQHCSGLPRSRKA